jgi:tetratricopeptide (TPR) repeat protein
MLLAIAADPQNPDLHTQLGGIYLGRRDVGDRARKAVSEFEQAVRVAPKEASSYQNLGIACAAANDLGRAAANLEHAIDLQPGYGPSYEELGRVYAKMGDNEGSHMMLSLYRKYVRFDQKLKTLVAKADQNKSDPAAQVELADVLYQSGDYASALDRYVLALKLKPNDTNTRRKYDRLLQTLTRSKTTHSTKRP